MVPTTDPNVVWPNAGDRHNKTRTAHPTILLINLNMAGLPSLKTPNIAKLNRPNNGSVIYHRTKGKARRKLLTRASYWPRHTAARACKIERWRRPPTLRSAVSVDEESWGVGERTSVPPGACRVVVQLTRAPLTVDISPSLVTGRKGRVSTLAQKTAYTRFPLPR
jgi:hypothetical protein